MQTNDPRIILKLGKKSFRDNKPSLFLIVKFPVIYNNDVRENESCSKSNMSRSWTILSLLKTFCLLGNVPVIESFPVIRVTLRVTTSASSMLSIPAPLLLDMIIFLLLEEDTNKSPSKFKEKTYRTTCCTKSIKTTADIALAASKS